MSRTAYLTGVVAMLAASALPSHGAGGSARDELEGWVAAKFRGAVLPAPAQPGIIVYANNDPVQVNARAGRPLRIGEATFTRGLYCHAVSDLLVRLPGPGKRFEATVGVDSNEQTRPGRGSVVFSVEAGDTERLRSPVMREGTPAFPVAVDLDGAVEFRLRVGDAGDGISCDQADWADARVVFGDGSILPLGDLPLRTPARDYTTEPPFSFVYGGKPSAELLPTWRVTRSERSFEAGPTGIAVTYTDPATGLSVRLLGTRYWDFPVVEWMLYLRNEGTADTPLLSNIQAVDTTFTRGPEGESVLHHNTGSPCTPTDYEPFDTPLPPGTELPIATSGGRSSNASWPYFALEWPDGGVLMAIGWPGQWAARFTRDDGAGLRVSAGQELTHFVLHPNEEVRTPLIALLFWSGDRWAAQNAWRRWMLAHNLPWPHSKAVAPQAAACSSHQFGEMIGANEENQKLFVDRYLEEKIRLDYWWMDAGWYVNESGWPNTGTWEVDRKRFPGGLRAITDYIHEKGVRSIVWFEPERVTPGTWLYTEHPEWLLGRDGEQKLLDLGNAEARSWLTEHVDGLIASEGIDLYRNDFNIDPLPFWRSADAADRQGITEIRYVEGFLAFWDELRRRHPDMQIDTCASGGRRNDLETLRRSVPLLRSDYIIEPLAQQLHTYGLAPWVPFYGTGINASDAYTFRSTLCPHLTFCYDVRNHALDYDSIRRVVGEWRAVAPCLLGDFYPLTPYRTEGDVWMAWQFDLPEEGRGIVQAFRRPESIYETARVTLHGLDPAATYEVTDLDSGAKQEYSGRDLGEKGLALAIPTKPGAGLWTYRRL